MSFLSSVLKPNCGIEVEALNSSMGRRNALVIVIGFLLLGVYFVLKRENDKHVHV